MKMRFIVGILCGLCCSAQAVLAGPAVQKCGNKFTEFGVSAGFTITQDGKTTGVSCKAGEVCVEPVKGEAKCAGLDDPQLSQQCYLPGGILFTYSDSKTKTVDRWRQKCADGKLCIAPSNTVKPTQLAQCVDKAKVEISCRNPNALLYKYAGNTWSQNCPTELPFCDNGACVYSPSCKDNDDPNNKGVTTVETDSTKEITLPDGSKKTIPVKITKTVLDEVSATTASSVTVGTTNYPDICKDKYTLMEAVCTQSKLIDPVMKKAQYYTKPSTQPFNCTDLESGFVCKDGACVPEFDCNAPLDTIVKQYPKGTVEGKPGVWHVSICSQPFEVFLNSWVTHLVCFKAPGADKPILVKDKVQCADAGTCDKGLCSGKKVPFCTANNEKGNLKLKASGSAQSGVGTTVFDSEISHCTGFDTIKYPVCDAEKITWEQATCPDTYFCVKSKDPKIGDRCVPITACDKIGGVIVINKSIDSETTLSDECTGGKTPGKQGTKKIAQWECIVAVLDVKETTKDCAAGQSCCVQGDKPVCSATCPPDPPPPPTIFMNFTCSDDDPTNNSQKGGTVTVIGHGNDDPTLVSTQEKKDQCNGQDYITQFGCKKEAGVYESGQGMGQLLDDLGGKKSCTDLLKAEGVALTPDQVGICDIDPATKAAICKPFTPTPAQPVPPPPPPSFGCTDNDPTNDPMKPGAVTITKPDNTFTSIEDFCGGGDAGVTQYECSTDDTGAAIWKMVEEENGGVTPCSNGCAQGKCCKQGAFVYLKGVKLCFEDFK